MEVYTPEILIPEDEIALRVQALGHEITKDYANEEITIVCVLKGAFIFCSDLMKKINLPVNLEFVAVSSYGDKTYSSGQLKWELDFTSSLEGKNVLIVEDIVDSGLTLRGLIDKVKLQKPKSVKTASLLLKPSNVKSKVDVDYLAFEIEDKFVIGYGLDYAGRYRELPYLGILNAGH